MARGFKSAPGASDELREALEPELDRARMLALGTSKNALVRAAVAARRDCPFGLMVTLAHDYSADVRCAVAANPRAQRSVMQYLSADRSVPVVLALLENRELAEDILEDLAFHKKEAVRHAASARLDTGLPGVHEAHLEDEHTPELAEHASLAMDVDEPEFPHPIGFSLVGLAVEKELAIEPLHDEDAGAEANVAREDDAATAEDGSALRVAQFFSHSDGHAHALATRTAPVRGFRPPEG